MKALLIALGVLFFVPVWGQIEQDETAIFKVEFEKFQPATQDQIREFEGKKPMQFLAPDINGEEQFLGNFKGKTVFIYFFNKECTVCAEHIATLNLIEKEKNGALKIIAIGDETKEELQQYVQEQGIEYTVMYNGKMLGEAAYGIEMGYPRLFAVDPAGVTKQVLPSESFVDSDKTYLMLSNVYDLVTSK